MNVYMYEHYIYRIVLYKSSSVHQKPIVSSFDFDLISIRNFVLRRILFLGILFGGLETGVFSLEVEKLEHEEGLCIIREKNLLFGKRHVVTFVVNHLEIYVSES